MANSLSEMIQEIVNKSYEEKVMGAKLALGECFGILNRIGLEKEKSTMMLITFLTAAVAVNGEFSAPERRMLKDIFDDDFEGLVKAMDKEAFDMMNQMVDTLDGRDKASFCLLAIFILAVDDEIDVDEYKYLIKLLQ